MWKKIFENISLKLGALFLALLLWFHVTTDRSYEYALSYPLEITNIPDNLILYEDIPKEVKVLVGGKGKTLVRLFLSQKETLRIDGSKLRATENNYQINPEQISLPSENLKVAEILSPKEFKIKLDYLMQKRVNVVSQIIIQPDADFLLLEEAELRPQEVIVEGPRRFVRLINSVLTLPKVLEAVREPISETVDLVQPEGFNVKCQPEKVGFFVNVQKGERREMSVRISDSNPSSGKKVKITPDYLSLTLLGEKKRLDMLTPEDVRATLELNDSKGKYKLSPKITLPSQVKLIQVTPDSVEVEIK
jgi:YbbR domain-containing protein